MTETTITNCNYIISTVSRIDKLQKEIGQEESVCGACDTSLITRAFNTIPVSFRSCCGTGIVANLDLTGAVTEFFRIESIRDQRFVTLRLLEATTGEETTLTGTTYTCIIDLNCVGSMQCYDAINVEPCV